MSVAMGVGMFRHISFSPSFFIKIHSTRNQVEVHRAHPVFGFSLQVEGENLHMAKVATPGLASQPETSGSIVHIFVWPCLNLY